MKASNGFCTWRPLVGAAMVGALAFAVGVQGSPRVGGERDKGKSQASRVVAGPSAHINSAIAAGATATATLQVVPPKTVPASAYPGTIVGQTLTLTSLPPGGQNVWFEILFTGWAPQQLKTAQAKFDETTLSGANAVCGTGGGGADLKIAEVPCVANTDCRATVSGLTAACGLGEPSSCLTSGGANMPWFPAGKFCAPGFQDKCDAEWIGTAVPTVAAVNLSIQSIGYGFTTEPGNYPTDFAPSYQGTLVLTVPAGAKGTYTLGFVVAETFLQELDEATGDTLPIPIAAYRPGVIDIPCGKCCYGVGTPSDGCVDGLSASECAAQPAVAIFTAGDTCDNPPTSDGCCACLTNADCNDGDACTTDICNSCVCSNNPKASWDQVTECCDSATGVETTLGCADQCEAASCTLAGNHGSAQCLPRTGETCDDMNPCTYADTCAAGAGSCAGLPAGGVACTEGGGECLAATGVDYPCIEGFCYCTLTPDLGIVIDVGGKGFDPECYNDGEKITGRVVVGASSSPINGAQIALTYDPTCLDYNGIDGVAPFVDTVYGPIVNEAAGSIFIAVGVGFGMGNGPNGNADILAFSFTKIGECNSCDICFTDNNPMHTYLTDDAGQRISVQTACSGTIRANNDVILTVPGNIDTNVDCETPTAAEYWDAPTATDTCGTSQVFCRGDHFESGMIWDNNTVMHGGVFPIGSSSFCCYAVSDYCGKIAGCPPDTSCPDMNQDGFPDGCWTVKVNDETSLDINVALSPTSQSRPGDSLTRCIKFTLYTDCILEPLVFSDDVTFGGMFDFVGKSTGMIKVPGSGKWDCITAQDQLHTLRSCYTFNMPQDCVDGVLSASFSGDPRLGGNWLIGGNLDGWKKDDPNANPSLDVIDILDYGTFVSQYLRDYGFSDTPCGTEGPNADINGDGIADLDDYAFVSMNFLTSSKQCCCGPQTAGINVVTEISVAQLRTMGLGDLAVADLNGDGLLNLADMAAFDQGVRPTKTAPTKGGTRSGTR